MDDSTEPITDRSSPLLFEDSQNGDQSMEVLNGSRNDSKETNCEDIPNVESQVATSPFRPEHNLFSSQQQFMADTPSFTLPRTVQQSPSRSTSLSLSKRMQTSKPLDVIAEDSPLNVTPIEDDHGSFGSMSSITDHGTPKTERGRQVLKSAKRKVMEQEPSSDSDIEVLSEKEEKDVEAIHEEPEKKRPRQSVEFLESIASNTSTPRRTCPSPFKAEDISDDGAALKTIPEESDSMELRLHYTQSQDTELDKMIRKESAEEEENNDDSITITSEKKREVLDTSDTIRLESSDPEALTKQVDQSKNDSPLEDEVTKKKKQEEGFVLVKILYNKDEDNSAIENVQIAWQRSVTLDFEHESQSSIRSSTSPGSCVSSDLKDPKSLFALPGRKQSIASSSSSSSSGANIPWAVKNLHRKGPLQILDRTLRLQQDRKFCADNLLYVKCQTDIDQSVQTEEIENKVAEVIHKEGESRPENTETETPNVKASGKKSTSTRSTKRGRNKNSIESATTSEETPVDKKSQVVQKRGRKRNGNSSAPVSPEPSNSSNSHSLKSKTSTAGSTSKRSRPYMRTSEQKSSQISDDGAYSQDMTELLVFAKWQDKRYYPGRTGQFKNGQWEIHFDDGNRRTMLPENFVVVERLNAGQPIYAVDPLSEDYYPGIILEYSETARDDVVYEVELHEKGKHVVKRSQISLTEDQIKYLRENTSDSSSLTLASPHRHDVSLDNLMDGKRNRGRRLPESTSVSGRSSRAGGLLRPRRLHTDQPSTSGRSEQVTVEPILSDSAAESSAAELSAWNEEWESLPGLDKSEWPEILLSKKKADMEKDFGPFPLKEIFKGYIFCMTYSPGSDITDSDAEYSQSSQDVETVNKYFHKRHIQMQIQKGGGKIVEFFEPSHLKESRDKCLLLSNRCNLNAKSIMCLALGIPTLRYSWVKMCCEQNVLHPPKTFYLPVGFSDESSRLIGWTERKLDPLGPFHSCHIAVVSQIGQSFLDYWKLALTRAKAKEVFAEHADTFCNRNVALGQVIDVIITDGECSELEKKAKEMKVPLVNVSWLVQCLVQGKLVPTVSHLYTLNQSIATVTKNLLK